MAAVRRPLPGAAAIPLRRTVPASGVKPAGRNTGCPAADIFSHKTPQRNESKAFFLSPDKRKRELAETPAGLCRSDYACLGIILA